MKLNKVNSQSYIRCPVREQNNSKLDQFFSYNPPFTEQITSITAQNRSEINNPLLNNTCLNRNKNLNLCKGRYASHSHNLNATEIYENNTTSNNTNNNNTYLLKYNKSVNNYNNKEKNFTNENNFHKIIPPKCNAKINKIKDDYINYLQRKFEDNTKNNIKLNNNNKELLKKCDDLIQDNKLLNMTLNERTAKLNKILQENRNLKTENEKLCSVNENNQQKINFYEEQFNIMQSNNENYLKMIKELKEQNQQLNLLILQNNQKNQEISENKVNLQKTNEEQELKINLLKAENQNLLSENQSFKKQIEQFNQEIENLNEIIKQKENIICNLKFENEEKNKIDKSFSSWMYKENEIKNNNNEINQSLNKLMTDNEENKIKIELLNDKIKLVDEMEKRYQKLISSNTNSQSLILSDQISFNIKSNDNYFIKKQENNINDNNGNNLHVSDNNINKKYRIIPVGKKKENNRIYNDKKINEKSFAKSEENTTVANTTVNLIQDKKNISDEKIIDAEFIPQENNENIIIQITSKDFTEKNLIEKKDENTNTITNNIPRAKKFVFSSSNKNQQSEFNIKENIENKEIIKNNKQKLIDLNEQEMPEKDNRIIEIPIDLSQQLMNNNNQNNDNSTNEVENSTNQKKHDHGKEINPESEEVKTTIREMNRKKNYTHKPKNINNNYNLEQDDEIKNEKFLEDNTKENKNLDSYFLYSLDRNDMFHIFDIKSKIFTKIKLFSIDDISETFKKDYQYDGTLLYNTLDGVYILTGEKMDTLYFYNSVSKNISKLCKFKNDHSNGSLMLSENILYVFGGEKSKSCEYYSLIDKKINELPDLNTDRANASFIILNNKIYGFFGFSYNSDTFANNIEFLNLDTKDKWEILTDIKMLKNNIEFNMESISTIYDKNNPNKVMIYSGIQGENEDFINDFYLLYDAKENTMDKIDKWNVDQYKYYGKRWKNYVLRKKDPPGFHFAKNSNFLKIPGDIKIEGYENNKEEYIDVLIDYKVNVHFIFQDKKKIDIYRGDI